MVELFCINMNRCNLSLKSYGSIFIIRKLSIHLEIGFDAYICSLHVDNGYHSIHSTSVINRPDLFSSLSSTLNIGKHF